MRLDPEFVKGLEYRRTRTYNTGFLEDIQDGKAYQALLRPGGFLHEHPWNLVLGFNTDGVSPYKSSRFQMWPIFWQVHDLPPHLRFQPKFNRVCALWFGKSKPRFNLFLQPFRKEMTRFYGASIFVFVVLVPSDFSPETRGGIRGPSQWAEGDLKELGPNWHDGLPRQG